jgi:hypothetical protein
MLALSAWPRVLSLLTLGVSRVANPKAAIQHREKIARFAECVVAREAKKPTLRRRLEEALNSS